MTSKLFSNKSGTARFRIFSVVTLAVTALLLFGTFVLVTQRLGYTSVKSELTAAANNMKSHLQILVSSEIALAKRLADSPAIRRHFMDPHDTELKQIAIDELKSYERHFGFKTLFWVNDYDKIFYYSSGDSYLVDTNHPENYWYNLSLYETDIYNFNIDYTEDVGETNLWINVPIFSDSNKPIGIAGTYITIDDFLNQVFMADDAISLYIFNQFSEITVARKKQLVFDKALLPNHLGDIGAKILSLAENKQDDDEIFFIQDNTMYYVTSIPFMQWYLVCSSSIDFFTLVDPMIVLIFICIFAICAIFAAIFNMYVSKIYRELVLANEQADTASRAKSAFLARMSHEIRTPLGVVTGFCELAHRERGKPEAQEYLVGIKRAGESLLGIVNDILDFSKIEFGHLTIDDSPYHTASLLNDVLAAIRFKATEKLLTLTTDIAPDIPCTMIGDAGRIRQILLNLLSNAVKYSTEGGSIQLTIFGERTAENAIHLTLSVEDSGIGIKQEELPKVFDDFTRLDEKRNSAIEGTGLGLPIARSLCRAMGGDLLVVSEYGKGSLFTATLMQSVNEWEPMSDLASPKYYPEAPVVTFSAPKAEVLLVDDFPDNLRVAEGLLRPYRMRVQLCRNGLEALDLVQSHNFDLVLMDHMMPVMDGMEATTHIRALGGRFAALPIVALTANVVGEMREFFLEHGFSDYISKPIAPAMLDAVLARWIPKEKQSPAETAEQAPQSPGRHHTEAVGGKAET